MSTMRENCTLSLQNLFHHYYYIEHMRLLNKLLRKIILVKWRCFSFYDVTMLVCVCTLATAYTIWASKLKFESGSLHHMITTKHIFYFFEHLIPSWQLLDIIHVGVTRFTHVDCSLNIAYYTFLLYFVTSYQLGLSLSRASSFFHFFLLSQGSLNQKIRFLG